MNLKKLKNYLPAIVISSFMLLLFSCDAELSKGKTLPIRDAKAIWNTLYKDRKYDGQRIAIEGFISLENWRQRGDDIYCEFVDANKEHLMYITIKASKKNSVNLGKTGNTTAQNNLHYDESDTTKYSSIDNEGKQIPIANKILLSFDIKYGKDQETGKYIDVIIPDNLKGFPFEKYSKVGDKYNSFHTENFRIDKL